MELFKNKLWDNLQKVEFIYGFRSVFYTLREQKRAGTYNLYLKIYYNTEYKCLTDNFTVTENFCFHILEIYALSATPNKHN
jgi:hypothetical protein